MSSADTLTTFLYTLSHPTELDPSTTTFNPASTSTSIIFILDRFDEFLPHPRQTLLYNLFDIAQSRKAPIAVICLGRQVNVIDGLEKRVKSRFGGRIEQVGRPRTLEEFWKVCKGALSVEGEEPFMEMWNKHVEVFVPCMRLGLMVFRDSGRKGLLRMFVRRFLLSQGMFGSSFIGVFLLLLLWSTPRQYFPLQNHGQQI